MGTELASINEAHRHWSPAAGVLIRKAAKAVKSKLVVFLAFDDEVTNPDVLASSPMSNDFVESLHATLGMLVDRLAGINPSQAMQLLMQKQSKGALAAMRVPFVPTEEQVQRAREAAHCGRMGRCT
eukprot:TRINITY_DN8408_c0_g1_i3.p2 TRINITY_DN8408_c0_g1~~TRINITY_DN8408_c0_g1_i3.p2  ORF type:complete len:126 (+),score=1.78 TRINITY_DN8408_c0_g1_i3:189-566(+)